MKELHGTLYGITIIAKTMTELKRKASRIANNYFSAYDTMKVNLHDIGKCENIEQFTLTRVNKKAPSNRIVYGSWN